MKEFWIILSLFHLFSIHLIDCRSLVGIGKLQLRNIETKLDITTPKVAKNILGSHVIYFKPNLNDFETQMISGVDDNHKERELASEKSLDQEGRQFSMEIPNLTLDLEDEIIEPGSRGIVASPSEKNELIIHDMNFEEISTIKDDIAQNDIVTLANLTTRIDSNSFLHNEDEITIVSSIITELPEEQTTDSPITEGTTTLSEDISSNEIFTTMTTPKIDKIDQVSPIDDDNISGSQFKQGMEQLLLEVVKIEQELSNRQRDDTSNVIDDEALLGLSKESDNVQIEETTPESFIDSSGTISLNEITTLPTTLTDDSFIQPTSSNESNIKDISQDEIDLRTESSLLSVDDFDIGFGEDPEQKIDNLLSIFEGIKSKDTGDSNEETQISPLTTKQELVDDIPIVENDTQSSQSDMKEPIDGLDNDRLPRKNGIFLSIEPRDFEGRSGFGSLGVSSSAIGTSPKSSTDEEEKVNLIRNIFDVGRSLVAGRFGGDSNSGGSGGSFGEMDSKNQDFVPSGEPQGSDGNSFGDDMSGRNGGSFGEMESKNGGFEPTEEETDNDGGSFGDRSNSGENGGSFGEIDFKNGEFMPREEPNGNDGGSFNGGNESNGDGGSFGDVDSKNGGFVQREDETGSDGGSFGGRDTSDGNGGSFGEINSKNGEFIQREEQKGSDGGSFGGGKASSGDGGSFADIDSKNGAFVPSEEEIGSDGGSFGGSDKSSGKGGGFGDNNSENGQFEPRKVQKGNDGGSFGGNSMSGKNGGSFGETDSKNGEFVPNKEQNDDDGGSFGGSNTSGGSRESFKLGALHGSRFQANSISFDNSNDSENGYEINPVVGKDVPLLGKSLEAVNAIPAIPLDLSENIVLDELDVSLDSMNNVSNKLSMMSGWTPNKDSGTISREGSGTFTEGGGGKWTYTLCILWWKDDSKTQPQKCKNVLVS